MSTSGKQGGKGAAKFGRNDRSGAATRYKSSNRAELNKQRRIAKHAKQVERRAGYKG